MKILGVIPARYDSSRFPGKVLANIKGKPMVQWVHEGANKCEALTKLVVATDNEKVKEIVERFGGEVVMTNDAHISGTDRCCEAFERLQEEYDIVVNIQCDLPLIKPQLITTLVESFGDKKTDIATLAAPLTNAKHLVNPNVVKVIFDDNNNAIYFSRAAIPFCRDTKPEEWTKNHDYFEHMGLYAYRSHILEEVVQLHPTKMEQVEKLEQLRWIEHGYRIKIGMCDEICIGVDTEEGLQHVIDILDSKEKPATV